MDHGDLLRQRERMADLISNSKNYQDLLARLKSQIRTAQVRAAVAVNQELVLLYWGIGKEILTRQREDGWGTRVIDRLAKDLRSEFPDMQGLSPRNLDYMKAFAEAWPDGSILQAPLAKLTWYHNLTLLEKVKSPEGRIWYAEQTIQNGWSRNVLVLQMRAASIGGRGRRPQTSRQHSRHRSPTSPGSLIKDPYNFDFLTLTTEAQERDLERGLLEHLRSSSSNSAPVSPSSGARFRSKSAEKTSNSICFSTT